MRRRIRQLLREYEVRPGEKVIWDKDGTTTILDADGAIRLIKWDENNIKNNFRVWYKMLSTMSREIKKKK